MLDIPQLCVELGLFDALLKTPPSGDTPWERLKPFKRVFADPSTSELLGGVCASSRRGG